MKNELTGILVLIAVVLAGVVIGALIMDNVHYSKTSNTSPNEQTLNAYATFESNCHYRGYDRNECLLIWSGR